MLYHIPIEPYETRYTADWIQQFEKEFTDNGIKFETILGSKTTNVINEGSVLDACGTHVYKFSQLHKLIEKMGNKEINDGDIIFFSDLWFPGIESLFYIRNIINVDFKIVGVLHAGTYDFADFTYRTGMRPWGKHLEKCWFTEFDKIFVATNFHKELILKNTDFYSRGQRDEVAAKIDVTGIPFYANDFNADKKKENIVVFPHRIDEEKKPKLFDKFSNYPEFANFEFIKTMDVTKTRQEYFDLLEKSKIMLSFAEQETFGYSTVEAMASGNVVIVPNKLSYKETVPAKYRYDTLEEARTLLNKAINGELVPDYPQLGKWANSINNMLDRLRVW